MGDVPMLFSREYLASLNAVRGEVAPPRRLDADERKALFAAEYAVDLNGKQAAIRAGYSPHTAEQQASRLLRNVKVQQAVKAAVAERMKRVALSAENVLEQLRRLVMFDIRDLYRDDGTLREPHEWPDEVASAITGLDVEEIREYDAVTKRQVLVGFTKKPRVASRLEAIKLAMQYHQLIGADRLQDGALEPGAALGRSEDQQLVEIAKRARDKVRALLGPPGAPADAA